MPVFSISTLRNRLDAAGGQAFTVVEGRPSFLGRVVAGAVVLVTAVLLIAGFVFLVIPALLLAAGVGLCLWARHSIRRTLTSARAPNGILDERRNVRVVVRDVQNP